MNILSTSLAPYVSPERTDGTGTQIAAAVAAALLTAGLIFAVPHARRAFSKDRDLIGAAVMACLITGFLAGCVVMVMQYADHSHHAAEARAAYTSEVRGWLASGYGIRATGAEAESVGYGKKLATVRDDELIVIRMIPVTGGTVALVDQNGKLVPAVH